MSNSEINIIKNIQLISDNNKIFTYISELFNLKLFSIIILLLFLFKKIKLYHIIILFIGQIVIITIKDIIKRERPYVVSNEVILRDPYYFDRYSFPSGHTVNAFLLTYILKKYSNIDLTIIPYLVGFSRVYLGVHYPTDIIGGFLLSKIIIKLFLKD
jgi:undecaprenyl-diphosphatase